MQHLKVRAQPRCFAKPYRAMYSLSIQPAHTHWYTTKESHILTAYPPCIQPLVQTYNQILTAYAPCTHPLIQPYRVIHSLHSNLAPAHCHAQPYRITYLLHIHLAPSHRYAKPHRVIYWLRVHPATVNSRSCQPPSFFLVLLLYSSDRAPRVEPQHLSCFLPVCRTPWPLYELLPSCGLLQFELSSFVRTHRPASNFPLQNVRSSALTRYSHIRQ